MSKLYAVFVVLIVLSLGASAQDASQDAPRVEIFTGYSVNHVSFPFSTKFDLGNVHGNLQGWNFSAAVTTHKWLALAADFGGYYGTATGFEAFKPPNCVLCTTNFGGTLRSVHTFVAGPQIFHRQGGVTIFAHSLFGGASTKLELTDGVSPITPQTDTSFAMVLGGGADFKISPHVALRAQPGYLMTSVVGTRQNNLRFSAGLVFGFGQ